jgi:hypothetical protein
VITEIKALKGQFQGLEKAAKSSSEEIQRTEIKALKVSRIGNIEKIVFLRVL